MLDLRHELASEGARGVYLAELKYQKRINRTYPFILYPIILSFLLLSTIAHQLHIRHQKAYGTRPYSSNKFSRYLRSWHTQTLHATHHLQPFYPFKNSRAYHIPTLAQSYVIGAYIIINILLLLTPPMRLFSAEEGALSSKVVQVVRYFSLRAGSLVYIQLPILAVTGPPARFYADILTACTGWSRDSLNLFHRWTGRIVFTHSCIHAVGYTIKNLFLNPRKPGRNFWEGIIDGILRMVWEKTVNQFGLLLFTGMCFLAIPSTKSNRLANAPVQRKTYLPKLTGYEAFLYLHILGSTFILAFGVCHLYWTSKKLWWWVIVYGSLWLLDRLSRLWKTRRVDAHARLHPSGIITLSLRLPVLPNHEEEEIEKWRKPGRIVHLSISGWKNTHPFSVADAIVKQSTPPTLELILHIRALQGFTRDMWASHRARVTHPTDPSSGLFDENEEEEVPVVENHRRRRESTISNSSLLRRPVTVRLEGPYGHTSPIFGCDTIILVAGGVGVALTVSYLDQILREQENQKESQDAYARIGSVEGDSAAPAPKVVKFVWAVREFNEFQILKMRLDNIRKDIATLNRSQQEQSPPGQELRVEFDIYITRRPPDEETANAVLSPVAESAPDWDLPPMRIHSYVRPQFPQIIRTQMAASSRLFGDCKTGQTSFTVFGCGGAPVLDSLRVAVAKEEQRERKRRRSTSEAFVDVEYYEHGYSW